MRVIGINGSPRMKASSTYRIMQPFLEGMQAAGWETEAIHVRQLDLQPCIGCFSCWVRTPGVCIHKDGMGPALEKYNRADLVVFGTPLYHFTMSGLLKNFIDRTLPRVEPWLIQGGAATSHPGRVDKPKQMFLISPCGFPEFSHFELLVTTFQYLARVEGLAYLGEILRPGAEPLSQQSMQPAFAPYYDLVRQAGEQVGRYGCVSEDLQTALRQDLFPGGPEAFRQLANAYWTDMMDRHKVPADARHTIPVLAAQLDGQVAEVGVQVGEKMYVPNEVMMRVLAAMYNPLALPDLSASIQFVFLPPQDFDPGLAEWYLTIEHGVCTIHPGRTALPTLTIMTPNDVWMQIGTGQLDAEEAFVQGKYEIAGSLQLLAEFPRIFDYLKPAADGGGTSQELAAMMLGMPQAFDPQAIPGLEAVIQFILGGQGGGMYYLRIHNDQCSAHAGMAVEPTMSIQGPAKVWLKVARGELDGEQAFMSGQYRVTGDLTLLLKFNHLFAAAPAEQAPNPIDKEAVMSENLTCRDLIAGMPNVFNPQAAGNLSGDIQFHVTGQEPGEYYLQIAGGQCAFFDGTSAAPKLTIDTPAEVWMAISRGELDGQMAFMQGKYRVNGDFTILMKMGELFKSA